MTKRELVKALRGTSANAEVFVAIAGSIECISDVCFSRKRKWWQKRHRQAIISTGSGEYTVLVASDGRFATINLTR